MHFLDRGTRVDHVAAGTLDRRVFIFGMNILLHASFPFRPVFAGNGPASTKAILCQKPRNDSQSETGMQEITEKKHRRYHAIFEHGLEWKGRTR
jgi:hypothetical protein